MLVIPAIDVRGGRCVRLVQGDYARETVYDDDPIGVAERWAAAGAERLHVVDLDGAAGDRPRNLDVVARLAARVAVPVQMGGGLKRWQDIVDAFACGVERVILGTAALEDRGLVERAVAAFGERIIVGIDARDGLVATRGWRQTSGVSALALARAMEALGVRRLIYTDIARDGTLSEPNYAAVAEVRAAVSIPVIASGGVASVEHVRRLARLGVEAAIVGRALYTGQVDLAAALWAAREEGGGQC